jgi:hypothetical protein
VLMRERDSSSEIERSRTRAREGDVNGGEATLMTD